MVKRLNPKRKKPLRKTFLPFSLPLLGKEEKEEVAKTLDSGWLTTGPQTHRFEEEFKKYIGIDNAVALSSCTAALNLSLGALNISPGDEVITTTFTFAATGNMIVLNGAKPVLVDIEPKYFNIDDTKIESKINRKTKAIIMVHYAGYPSRIDKINSLAKKYKLKVIEDAAHALGAKYHNKMVGSGQNLTCFSFYPIKNITTGEGGMVTTPSKKLADKIRVLSLHGIDKNAWKRYKKEGSWYYQIIECGNKYNLTDLQSSLGLVQLRKLEKFLKIREEYTKIYNKSFNQVEEIIIPAISEKNIRHARHLYHILLQKEKLSISRNQFIEELKNENIGTSVHFIPLHLHPFYQNRFGYKKGDFPVAEYVYERIISLPLYPKMCENDVYNVIEAVKKIIKRYSY